MELPRQADISMKTPLWLIPKEGMMKLLLTSAGINNTSIHDALVDLLGKPIAESTKSLSGSRKRRPAVVTLSPHKSACCR